MRGSNVFAPSQRIPALWLALQVGLGWRMWGSTTGASRRSLLESESRSSDGGIIGRTPCIRRRPNRGEPNCYILSKGLGRGLCEAQSPPGQEDRRSGEVGSLRAGEGTPS